MDSKRLIVRWHTPGSPVTRWHVDDPVLADYLGRTACGVRYQRRIVEVHEGEDDPELCLNCERALRRMVRRGEG